MVFPEALKVTIVQKSGEQENFVMSVTRHREICHSYENLKNEIVARYPGLVQSDEIKFYWIDDEGDEITIVNHADYFDYMDSSTANGTQKRRIYVKGINKPKKVMIEESPMEGCSTSKEESTQESLPEDVPIHQNIICDVCDDIIRGHRYKCLQCFNYDLCMRCEAKYRHKDHLMVRIPTPQISRRGPFRLFDKLRGMAAEASSQSGFATASDVHEDEYENCKRSKRYHRRHSKDREESRERREEKERKERKHRRERSAKCAEERRSARYGHGTGHHFNFSHLINQVIDPANISAFLSADAAAAAAAAAAESAHEAARATMANCPMFSTASHTSSSSATATSSASTSAQPDNNASAEKPEEGSAASSTSDGPQKENAFDLSWLSPTPESIQKINQTFSKILDPLGMNIEIRSNGSAPKPAQTQTPPEEKKDKTTETANTPTTSTPSQTLPVVDGTSNKSTEIDPIADLEQKLQAALLADTLNKKGQHNNFTHSDDDDSSSVSSVSLLSDNEAGNGEKNEKRWTLVDLPDDADKPTTEQTTEIAEEATAEPNVPSSMTQASVTPATPASVPEVASASSAPVMSIDYEQLGKALKQHIEAEKQAAAASKTLSTPPTVATSSRPIQGAIPLPPFVSQPIPVEIQLPSPVSLPTRTAIPMPAPVISLKQSFEASKQAAEASTTLPTVASSPSKPIHAMPTPIRVPQANPNITYSSRSHVNHAVHAMIAMGFSNEGGWLVQLLESVNGDIPRALDLLTPHKINP
ncbi:protein ref(2)P [Topomyia yanbarensis]|uniref:protein ref(2)P n=1 Tax=Topomyia yanbarensis TaxID=2498891 RepID=UPI00273C169F|nr:protein ref(2)P [Topomyia yanbarensis]